MLGPWFPLLTKRASDSDRSPGLKDVEVDGAFAFVFFLLKISTLMYDNVVLFKLTLD